MVSYTGLTSSAKGDLRDGTATPELMQRLLSVGRGCRCSQACKIISPTCDWNYTKVSKPTSNGRVALSRLTP